MIIRHDRLERDCLADERDWPTLTAFFRDQGAAVLIAPRWLLTAAHVARVIPTGRRLTVAVGARRYAMTSIVIHPGYRDEWEGEDDIGEHTVEDMPDIALVELESPVLDVAPMTLYRGSDEVDQMALLLGWGSGGNGKRGMVRGSDHALRKATNRITSAGACWLTLPFDEPPDCTELEGVCGAGDSGGPALLREGDNWLVAGVSSWQRCGDRPLGTYGCVEHYVRVSRFVSWIESVCGPL